MAVTKAVLLCGGLATRFLPYTKSVPKEMLPLLDKPLIHYIVNDLKVAGITDILIILGRHKSCLEDYFDRNVELEDRLKLSGKENLIDEINDCFKDVNITFIRQIDAKGTGYATLKAEQWTAGELFIVMLGDDITFCNGKNQVQQLLDCYNQTHQNTLCLQYVKKEETYKYGIVGVDYIKGQLAKINSFIEKPKVEDAPSNLSSTGAAIFNNEIFELTKQGEYVKNELYLTAGFDFLAKSGKFYGCLLQGDRHDIGNKLGFINANIYLALRDNQIKDDVAKYIIEQLELMKKSKLKK